MQDAEQPRCANDDDAYSISPAQFRYEIENQPFKQGAEARLYRCTYLGRPAIIKERFIKKYRHPELEESLTKRRIHAELRALNKCRQLGVDVPALYFQDIAKNRVIMERVEGELTARDFIEDVRAKCSSAAAADQDEHQFLARLGPLCDQMGEILAKMHAADIVHGDLTTSNMMLRDGDANRVVILDFGLSSMKATAEDKGVDLYVLEKAMLSTHPRTERAFEKILDTYSKHSGKQAKAVLAKLNDIRLRGRKRDMIG